MPSSPRARIPTRARRSPGERRRCAVEALAVRVFATPAALAQAAAEDAAATLRAAIQRQGTATAILASAASQVLFLEALARQRKVAWSQVTLFHMDEYLGLDAHHPASFRRFLRERVEQRVRPRAFHYLRGEADEPLRECDRYAALLQAQPIDLCCLGIGENGHIAFNDPHVADFEDPGWVKLVRLDEACRRQQVGEGAFPALERVPQFAYTLTIPALCSARRLIAVVPERRKAAAVRHALGGPLHHACPASILRRQAHATLYLDTASAAGSVLGSAASASPRNARTRSGLATLH